MAVVQKSTGEVLDPTGAPAQSGMVQLTFAQLQELIAGAVRAVQTGTPGEGESALKVAADALSEVGKQVKRTVRFSNEDHRHESVFEYPEGGRVRPKAPLKYECFLCGVRLRDEQLSPSEVTLLNRFDSNKEAQKGTWTATLDKNGSKMQLKISVPAATLDMRQNLPALTQILTELLDGQDAADPSRMTDRLLEMERTVAELKQKLAEKTVAA